MGLKSGLVFTGVRCFSKVVLKEDAAIVSMAEGDEAEWSLLLTISSKTREREASNLDQTAQFSIDKMGVWGSL